MRTLLSLGILGTTLLTGPAPTEAELENYNFNAREAGCMTRGLRAMDTNALVDITAKGEGLRPSGMTVTVNRPGLQYMLGEMSASAKACMHQFAALITPTDGEPDTRTINIDFR
ncbi:hypothetical protein [Deinococcus ficus]|uniref:Uncharacterized protein n=1 Tax=Deinococcus ficus TaxID=317577 RepID=A0A221T2V9_9DEIO|nr:hypothetical protein [Deinococcus ficus]ASN83229.1 hypothetical protein DFI_18705 [Deinococcus ficus]